MNIENLKSTWVLITGASGGIGADLAPLFARDGHPLILVARSRKALEALARDMAKSYGVKVRVFTADLSEPKAAERLYRKVQALKLEVDTLVNNAGFGTYGPFLQSDISRQGGMMRLNMVALTELSRLFTPDMVKRGAGRVLNVASTAAFQPGPGMAVYCATKAYVLCFTEALRSELKGTGVTVTCLCPGPTKTRFAEVSGADASKIFSVLKPMASWEVAAEGYKALQAGKDLVITGFLNRAMAFTTRFTPIRIAADMAGKFMEKQQ